MSKLSTFVAFVTGGAIGSLITWKFLKTKYEMIAQEEIDSVKETYSKRSIQKYEAPQNSNEDEETPKETERVKEKPDIMEYAARLSSQGYTTYSGTKDAVTKLKRAADGPRVVSPDEFGDDEEYSKITLYYYADGILCDDEDQPVDNIDDIVGEDFADHFGEYEDDSVFICNDSRRCYYEILKSLKTYREVIEQFPYKAEM